jgi:hypothetical protein
VPSNNIQEKHSSFLSASTLVYQLARPPLLTTTEGTQELRHFPTNSLEQERTSAFKEKDTATQKGSHSSSRRKPDI